MTLNSSTRHFRRELNQSIESLPAGHLYATQENRWKEISSESMTPQVVLITATNSENASVHAPRSLKRAMSDSSNIPHEQIIGMMDQSQDSEQESQAHTHLSSLSLQDELHDAPRLCHYSAKLSSRSSIGKPRFLKSIMPLQ